MRDLILVTLGTSLSEMFFASRSLRNLSSNAPTTDESIRFEDSAIILRCHFPNRPA
jgi:hypothetical protein